MTESWTSVWKLRESLYSYFANLLLEPIQAESHECVTTTFWNAFPIEGANPKLQQGLDGLIACSARLEEKHEHAIQEIMTEYTELFLGPGIPKAPLYQSFYQYDQKVFFGQSTFEMKQLLHHHGIESKKRHRQPEDHLGLQLMFLSLLTAELSSQSLEDGMMTVKAQLSFMENRLLTWIPELCRDAKQYGSVGYYGHLMELIWGILLWDKELLEEFQAEHEEMTEEASL